MICIREFEFVPVEEGGYVALPIGMEGATEGNSLTDAVAMAMDWLRQYALFALEKGEVMSQVELGSKPTHGGVVIAVAVEAKIEDVPAVTAAEAALRLGVSTARVAQLCKQGELNSWRVGATRMVSEDSIAYRLASNPKPGRPKKEPSIK